jgi:hypothetical protein
MIKKVVPAGDLAEHAFDVVLFLFAALEAKFICHLPQKYGE